MPNQPRVDNPRRSVRVEDDLWARAEARADRDGVTTSDVIRAALDQYTKEDPS